MKEDASIRKKSMALAAAVIMLLTVFAPASFVWAETDQNETVEVPPAAIQPAAVTLNRSSVSLKAGKKMNLKASVSPADAEMSIIWTSSDPDTAQVSSTGTITAKKPGTVKITAKSGDASAVCTVNITLAAPVGVKTKALGSQTIQIRWKRVAGAEGYKIYRFQKKNGTYKRIATVKGADKTSYKNKKRVTGKTYYYKVRAYSGSYVSDFSKRVSGKARPAKTAVKLKAGEEKIKVTWKHVKGAHGYHIYRAVSKDGDYERIGIQRGAKSTSFTHSGLKGGKTYHYKVRAYRKVNGQKVFSHSSKPVAAKAKKVKLKSSEKGFQYKKKFTVKAYSYTGGGRTAMGTKARVGAIAVDPKVIPLGTKVYVEGYGYATAEDTGGNIKGRTVDLYKNSNRACMKWGVRHVNIYVDVRK